MEELSLSATYNLRLRSLLEKARPDGWAKLAFSGYELFLFSSCPLPAKRMHVPAEYDLIKIYVGLSINYITFIFTGILNFNKTIINPYKTITYAHKYNTQPLKRSNWNSGQLSCVEIPFVLRICDKYQKMSWTVKVATIILITVPIM